MFKTSTTNNYIGSSLRKSNNDYIKITRLFEQYIVLFEVLEKNCGNQASRKKLFQRLVLMENKDESFSKVIYASFFSFRKQKNL